MHLSRVERNLVGAISPNDQSTASVDAPVVFLVLNNEGIVGHMIQDNFFPKGSPRIASLLPAHYEKMAEMVDGHAERVEQPQDIRPAIERALASNKVAVAHVIDDPKAMRLSGGNYMC